LATVTEKEEPTGLSVTEVRARLREAVLKSELRPATEHSQGEVRMLIDVGRTPFREALRMVQAEGLIQILSNGRLKIPELSTEDFTQVQIARMGLESAAARLSVPKLDPEDLAHLEGYMAQMSHYLGAEHFDRIESPHLDFHRGLVAGAGPELLAEINDLTDRAGRYRWAFSAALTDYWDTRTVEHRAILDAAKDGDPEGTAIRLVKHYLETGRPLGERLAEADGSHGREWFEERAFASLAPSVRSAVLDLK
jgi:DNA-binding GntR family transcriptional regulator